MPKKKFEAPTTVRSKLNKNIRIKIGIMNVNNETNKPNIKFYYLNN